MPYGCIGQSTGMPLIATVKYILYQCVSLSIDNRVAARECLSLPSALNAQAPDFRGFFILQAGGLACVAHDFFDHCVSATTQQVHQ
jgi:hypothetical protein